MVQAAVADVVGPTVPAEDPQGGRGQQVGVLQDVLRVGVLGIDLAQGRQGLAQVPGLRGVHLGQPGFGDAGKGRVFRHALHHDFQRCPAGAQADGHAVAELGVVLKQGVGPSGAFPGLVHHVGHAGHRGPPDGGAAGGIGNHRPVPKQLGDQFGIGGLPAAGAGPGVLQIGPEELTRDLVSVRTLLHAPGLGIVEDHLVPGASGPRPSPWSGPSPGRGTSPRRSRSPRSPRRRRR